jgi:hypothetical protein
MRCVIIGCAMVSATAADSVVAITGGVFGGATSAYQATLRKSG